MPRRTDANQRAIVAMMRKMGMSIAITSNLGNGFPDLVGGLYGINYLIEVKSTRKSTLTMHEAIFHDEWKGQICIIRSVDEAIEFVNKIRKTKINS